MTVEETMEKAFKWVDGDSKEALKNLKEIDFWAEDNVNKKFPLDGP